MDLLAIQSFAMVLLQSPELKNMFDDLRAILEKIDGVRSWFTRMTNQRTVNHRDDHNTGFRPNQLRKFQPGRKTEVKVRIVKA